MDLDGHTSWQGRIQMVERNPLGFLRAIRMKLASLKQKLEDRAQGILKGGGAPTKEGVEKHVFCAGRVIRRRLPREGL